MQRNSSCHVSAAFSLLVTQSCLPTGSRSFPTPSFRPMTSCYLQHRIYNSMSCIKAFVFARWLQYFQQSLRSASFVVYRVICSYYSLCYCICERNAAASACWDVLGCVNGLLGYVRLPRPTSRASSRASSRADWCVSPNVYYREEIDEPHSKRKVTRVISNYNLLFIIRWSPSGPHGLYWLPMTRGRYFD